MNTYKYSIDDCRNIASELGGKCLSDEYKGVDFLLQWECANGHVFHRSLSGVKKGNWCKLCIRSENNLKKAKEYAVLKKGKCLSEGHSFKFNSRMMFECQLGHRWEANLREMTHHKSWCPVCASDNNRYGGIIEEICRLIFQELFQKPFMKVRPNWLRGEKGKNYELDGYNDELKLAFEYQGVQHYIDMWGHLDEQKSRDSLKRKLAAQHGVTIIEIPPYKRVAKKYVDDMVQDIKYLLHMYGYNVMDKAVNIDYKSVYEHRGNADYTDYANKIVADKDWKYLSNQNVFSRSCLFSVECENGHHFQTSISNIERGRGCGKCSGVYVYQESDVDEFCKKNGIEKAFSKYIPGKRHKWKLPCGHEKDDFFCNIRAKKVCIECIKEEHNRKALEKKLKAKKHIVWDMLSVSSYAIERQLVLVSPEYHNNKEKLVWRCTCCNKEWSTSFAHIMRGQRHRGCVVGSPTG